MEGLVRRLRKPDLAKVALPHDVVITHDGEVVFAYAASEAALSLARRAIEPELQRDGLRARVIVSHWDDKLDDWLQVDPPLTGVAKQREQAAERDADAIETRTLTASAGKMIRAEIEQSMKEWAEQLDLTLSITEHRHLLTCQVLFEVTGAKRKIEEFAQGLNAEEIATLRNERMVIMSPL